MSENIRYFMRCPFCDNNPQSPLLERPSEAAIIRAFVERVEKRLPDYDTGRGADAMLKAYRQAVYDELAVMEAE